MTTLHTYIPPKPDPYRFDGYVVAAIRAWTLAGLLVSAVILGYVLVACAPKRVAQPGTAALVQGEATARAEVRNKIARVEISHAVPHADATGKVHLETATRSLVDQEQTDFPAMRQAYLDLAKESAATLAAERVEKEQAIEDRDWIRAKYDGLVADGWVKAALRVKAYWFWFKVTVFGLLGVWLVCGWVATVASGPTATVLLAAHHFAGGILSLGMTWLQSARDNFWFRVRAPKEKSRKIRTLEAMGAPPAVARAAVLA